MEVKIIADVNAKEYFEFVVSTVQSMVDISDAEDKTMRKGLKFERSLKTGFNKSEIANVKILDYVYPRVIEMEYKTSKQTNINKYVILPKGDMQCEVIYTEKMYDQNHKLKVYNTFTEKAFIKKTEKRMKDVAKYLIDKKKEVVSTK